MRAILFFLLATNVAFADEPLYRQKLIAVKIDIKPNALLGVKQVRGEVPVSLLTNPAGEIVAVQVGRDRPDSIQIENLVGQKWRLPMQTTVVRQNWGAKSRYQLVADHKFYSNQELFYLDATDLDSRRGGRIILRFPSSLILNTHHEVELKIKNDGARWVAAVNEKYFFGLLSEERNIESVLVRESGPGLGIGDPEFQSLDPQEMLAKLKMELVDDPRIISRHELKTNAMFAEFAKAVNYPENNLRIRLRELAPTR